MQENGYDAAVDEKSRKKKHIVKVILINIVLPALVAALVVNIFFANKNDTVTNSRTKRKEVLEDWRNSIKEDFLNLENHRYYIHVLWGYTDKDSYSTDEFETDLVKEYGKYIESDDQKIADVAYYCLGLAYVFPGENYRALENYMQVHDNDMKYLNNSIGYIYKKLGKYDRAIGYFEREIELEGNIEAAYRNLGDIYYNEHDFGALRDMIQNDSRAAGSISPRVYRVLLLMNGDITGYFARSVRFSYITLTGFVGAALITLIWFVYLRKIDVYEKESIRYMLLTFVLAMVCTEFCTLLYDTFDVYIQIRSGEGLLKDLAYCIFGIGLIEESMKLIPFLLMLKFSRQIDESIDFFIYASTAALGFAFMENLMYFQPNGLSNVTGRALTSVIMHMSLTSVAVYGLFYAKYIKRNANKLLCFAGSFAAAVVMHGSFDFFLISNSVGNDFRAFAFVILVVAVLVFVKMFKKAMDLSEYKKKSKARVKGLNQYLFCSMFWILLLQYLLIGYEFGPKEANFDILQGLVPFIYMSTFLRGLMARLNEDEKKDGKSASKKYTNGASLKEFGLKRREKTLIALTVVTMFLVLVGLLVWILSTSK